MKWPMVRLEEVATIVGGSTPLRSRQDFWEGDIPWVTPTDLPMPGQGIAEVTETADKITREALTSCSAQLLPIDTVLFSSRATIGKLGISKVPLATNQGFANFIPKPWINARFLAYSLQYHTPSIALLAGKTTFKEVSKGVLKHFRISLPPLSEQRRIVDILDQADALRRKRAEADAKAERILPALFVRIFGDPATNPKGWRISTLGNVTKIIHRYPTFYGQEYVVSGINVVRISDIRPNHILSREIDKYAKVPKQFSDKFPLTILQANDLVMAVRGDTTGKIGLVPDELSGSNISANLIRISPNPEIVNPYYFFSYMLLANSIFSIYITNTAKKSITANNIKFIPILIPPMNLQEQFGMLVYRILMFDEHRLTGHNRLEEMFSTLLHRAFSGELTTKWREAHMRELLAEMEQQAKWLTEENTRGSRETARLQQPLFHDEISE